MRKLLLILLLIPAFAAAQYPAGVDSVQINGRRWLIKVPSGAGPFALSIQIGDQNENLSNNTNTGMKTGLRLSGDFKKLFASQNPYFRDAATGDSLRWIIAKPQYSDYSDHVFQNEQIDDWRALNNYLGSKVDRTAVNGKYTKIAFMVVGRGADAIANLLAYISGQFGTNYPYFMDSIKYIYWSNAENLKNGSATADSAWARQSNKHIWYLEPNYNNSTPDSIKARITRLASSYQRLTRTALTIQNCYDSLFSTAAKDSAHNIYLQWLGYPGVPPAPNYPLKPWFIIDPTGATPRDPYIPEYGFDAFGLIDPKNGVTDFAAANARAGYKTDTSQFWPQKGYGFYFGGDIDHITYPGKRGGRRIFDFTGVYNWEDTTYKANITDIWAWVQSSNSGQKMYIYNLDTLYRVADRVQRQWMIARWDSLMHPIDSLVVGSNHTWSVATINKSMRYMGVRAVLDDNGKWPEFSEIVIYGSRNSDDSLSNVNNIRGQIYTGTLPSRKNARFTFGRVNGTNLLNGVRTQHLVNNGPVRVFTGKDYFDTARAVKNATVYIPWESPDVNYSFLDSLKAMGKIVFYTNQGARSYMSNNFGNTGWNIDSIGMEPEVMSSYTNEAKFQKNFAALYGSVNVSTSQTQWAGNPTNGRGLVKIMQIGNEVYAHGGSDIATFMMMSEAYDKIKSMDPNMIVVTPGTESHDTARTMTFSWLAYTVRADHKYPADIDDYHKYPNVVDTMRIGQTFDFGIQHLMHSEFPERWMKIGILAMTERINRRALVFMGNYNGDTTKQVATTEDGQDNWGSSTTFGSNIYSPEWTVYSTHGFAGFDSLQAKALMRSYYEFMVPFIPGEAFHCDYAMMNNFGDSVIHRQQFSSSGMASNYSGGPLFVLRDLYPWYQYRQCIYRLMQNYYADSVIAFNPLGKIHFRYRNINHPDSVINVIWYAKHDGTSLTGQTVDVGGTMFGNLVTEITPSFTNGTGTSVGRAVVGSSLTGVTFGDVPKIYVGLAIGGPVITNPQRGVPKKAFGRHVPKKV